MFKKVREGIIRCILATDMARHNEIVNGFREITPYFDKNNKAHVNLVRKMDKLLSMENILIFFKMLARL